jgi:sodium transport system permease protein
VSIVRAALVVLRKELLDLSRDRRTLFVLILLPMVLVPALMFGLGRLAMATAKSTALATVTFAATPESQAEYRRLAHLAFLDSPLATLMRVGDNPVTRLLRGGQSALPEGLWTDPEVFYQWAVLLGDEARRAIEEARIEQLAAPTAGQGAAATAPPGLAEAAEFLLRAVALVRFVDPADLPAAEVTAELPENLRTLPHGAAVLGALRSGRIHGHLEITPLEESALGPRLRLALRTDTSRWDNADAARRVEGLEDRAARAITRRALATAGIDTAILEPIRREPGMDIATEQQRVLAAGAGMVPYLMVVFIFLGAIYPALDLGAGEKERQTLETLLLAPVPRAAIAVGKLAAIFVCSLAAALLGLASLLGGAWLFLRQLPVGEGLLGALLPVMPLLVLLAVPTAATFSAVMFALSVAARSHREGQALAGPIGTVLILPAGVAMMPGIKSSAWLALVPSANLGIVSRDLLAGQFQPLHLVLAMASGATLAAGSALFAVWQFRREATLFRR